MARFYLLTSAIIIAAFGVVGITLNAELQELDICRSHMTLEEPGNPAKKKQHSCDDHPLLKRYSSLADKSHALPSQSTVAFRGVLCNGYFLIPPLAPQRGTKLISN
ncbi:hypothetical protein V8C37DRAFT_366211 [Trichoderma ceciliae]